MRSALRRVGVDERGVVAADVSPRDVGAVEKTEIVNSDDLGGGSRRQQQRVGRVRHVEGTTRQRFGAGPCQAVPEKIQQPDGYPSIDGRHPPQVGVVEPQAVAP